MKKKTTKAKLDFAAYPLIGYEYEYIGQPVKVLRVVPCQGQHVTPGDAYCDVETRFCDRTSCDAGELGKWQDTTKPLSQKQATMVMLALKDAIEDATTDNERRLAKWQYRKLVAARRAAAQGESRE